MYQMDIGISPKMKMSRLLNQSLFFMDLQTHYQHQTCGTVLARKIWRIMTMDIYKIIKTATVKLVYYLENLIYELFFKHMRIFQKC